MSKVPPGLKVDDLRELVYDNELEGDLVNVGKATRQTLWNVLEVAEVPIPGHTPLHTVKAQIRREITMTGKGCDGEPCKLTVLRVGEGDVQFEEGRHNKFMTTMENLKALMGLLESDV